MDLIKKEFLEWHSGIEKKIPCHFCSVKLSDEIYSCDFGHDVCQSCKTDSCNACKKSSSFFRNHIAEFLISQLNSLKSDVELMDDSVIIVKKPEKKYKSKFNQTKAERDSEILLAAKNVEKSVEKKSLNVKKTSEECVENKPMNVGKSSNETTEKKSVHVKKSTEECVENKPMNVDKSSEKSVDKKSLDVKKSSDEQRNNEDKPNDNSSNTYGVFSCWIGRDCYLKGDHSAILAHIKNSHSEVFVTHPFKGWPHVMSWDLNYNGASSREDRAFEIQGIGLFVLHIFTTNEQHLKAHVLMFDSGRTAAQYRYEMEIKSDDKKKSFSAAVDSSRLPRKILHDRNKGLFINEKSMLQNIIKMKMKYKCTVQIMKLDEAINDKKTTEDPVFSEDINNAKKNHQKLNEPFNKRQFKPPKKNANYLKNKSNPGLMDLKNIKIAHCSSKTPAQPDQNNVFRVPGVNSQQPHLYPNLQKEFNYQQMPPQNPHMVNNHINMNTPPSMNVQPTPFYPLPPAFKNEHYQRNAPAQNVFVHEPYSGGNQGFVPAQPSAPHIDMEGARNFHKSNKPGDFTVTDLERQKLIQQEIEAREKNRLTQSGATTFDSTQDEDRRKYKTSSNSQPKKPNECVLC